MAYAKRFLCVWKGWRVQKNTAVWFVSIKSREKKMLEIFMWQNCDCQHLWERGFLVSMRKVVGRCWNIIIYYSSMATQSILLLVPHDNCMMLAVQHAVEHFSSTRSLSAPPALSTSPLIPSNLLNLPGVTQVSALLILIDVNGFKSALVLIELAKKSLSFLLVGFIFIYTS